VARAVDPCAAGTVTDAGVTGGSGGDGTGVEAGATVRGIPAGVAPTVLGVVYRNRTALAATVATTSVATTIAARISCRRVWDLIHRTTCVRGALYRVVTRSSSVVVRAVPAAVIALPTPTARATVIVHRD
jgi:hypothetical protein